MSSLIESQFSYCLLIWIFLTKISMNKLNNICEKCLRLVTNEHDTNFNEQLESSHEFSIHKTGINYLMIEVYKYSLELMTDIFTSWKNPCNIL